MSDETGAATGGADLKSRLPAVLLFAAVLGILVFAYWDGLYWAATDDWQTDEYNHCWLIPFIALFLLAIRVRDLAAVPWDGSRWGFALLAVAFALLLLGDLSSIFTISQYGFILAVWGAVLVIFGWPFFRIAAPALVYLVFMVPLPDFLQVQLTADMQLWSSKLGVAVIRMAGVPVYLEGNVIDLGVYQLAVAEACSGLRYLFPLMSFGFLCAVLYQGPFWQRLVVFLSTVPTTLLMNSVRIGVIGLMVQNLGIEQAEGFLHDFEGWVVFMACVGILFAEMFVMARLSGRGLLRSLRMDTPPLAEMARLLGARPAHRLALVATGAIVAGSLVSAALGQRADLIPQRGSLATFPLVLADWHGIEQPVEKIFLDALKTDDTFLANYNTAQGGPPVNIWIAYYAFQRGGRAVHSPRTCLPGGGWELVSLTPQSLDGLRADGSALPVNRALIGLGDDRQLVYYWFAQRGRMLTNEYAVKWYIFWDALTRQRTDGALVRLTTFVDEGSGGIGAADKRLQDFARALDPKLGYFLPQSEAVLVDAGARAGL